MPEFDVSGFLSADAMVLNGVIGDKYPTAPGRTYTVPAPSAATEIELRRLIKLRNERDAADEVDGEAAAQFAVALVAFLVDGDGNEISFEKKLLGAAFQQMVDDEVSPSRLNMLANLVLTNYGVNTGSAFQIIRRAEGEVLARANRATRRAAKSTARKPRGSAAKAGSKSSPASSDSVTPATPTRASSSARKTSARKVAARKTA